MRDFQLNVTTTLNGNPQFCPEDAFEEDALVEDALDDVLAEDALEDVLAEEALEYMLWLLWRSVGK